MLGEMHFKAKKWRRIEKNPTMRDCYSREPQNRNSKMEVARHQTGNSDTQIPSMASPLGKIQL